MLLSILSVLTLLAVCYVLYKTITTHVTVISVNKVIRRSRDNRDICPKCLCLESSQNITIARLFVKAIFSTLKVILQAEGSYSQDIHSWILGPPIPDPVYKELTPCQLILALTRAGLCKNPGFSSKTQPSGFNWFKPGFNGFYGLNWGKLKFPM